MHRMVLPLHNQAITHFHHAFRQIHPMLSSHNMAARSPSHDRFYPRIPVSTQLRYSSTRKHDTAKSKLPVVSGFVHDYHNLKYPVRVPVSDYPSDVLPFLYPFIKRIFKRILWQMLPHIRFLFRKARIVMRCSTLNNPHIIAIFVL